MLKRLSVFVMALAAGAALLGGEALAEEFRSAPWQWWLQAPRSPSAEVVHELHNLIFTVEVAIVIFVLAIMGFIVIRFNAKANPVPSKTSHNTLLEIVWTVVPIIILVIIAVPSLKALYFADSTENPEMTIKVTGNQWYWTYTYPDHDEIEFDSIMIADEDLEEGQPRLLSVDNPLVLPVDTNIRIFLTTNDVIHNFAMPSLMLKLDTTPGRLNETWTKINDEGSYYGMCSELCGVNHGFMPVHIEAVSKEAFAAWLVKAKEEFASNDDQSDSTVKIATAFGQ